MPVRVEQNEEQFKKLFIGGLTSTTTDEMLKEFYSQWGEIVDVIVMKDGATKRSRGFGFVTYADPSGVDKAMANRPHEIDNKVVEPKRAIPRDSSGKSETNMSVRKLYVSGIREDHTDDMLRNYFSQFGSVSEVDIIVDKTTGKKRGFAFVSFDDYDPVDKCVLQKSHIIDDKRCDVKKALSKDEMKKAEMQRERFERELRTRSSFRDYGGGGDFGGYSGGYAGGHGSGYGGGYGGGSNPWAAGTSRGGPGGFGAGGYGSGGGYAGGSAGWGGAASATPWGASPAAGGYAGGQDWSARGQGGWGGAGGNWGRR